MRSGILGGTFDPIHLGHLRTAEEIGERMQLDRVCLIPSASPPHKSGEPVSPFRHRLAMARSAVGDAPRLEVLDVEGKRAGPSYSVDTLKECRRLLGPGAELFFILGMDAFLEIKTWKSAAELFDYAHFVVIGRPGYPRDLPESLLSELLAGPATGNPSEGYELPSGNRLMLKQSTLMDISSTRLRRMVREGRSIRFLVPEPVRRYISENGLYAE